MTRLCVPGSLHNPLCDDLDRNLLLKRRHGAVNADEMMQMDSRVTVLAEKGHMHVQHDSVNREAVGHSPQYLSCLSP